jgi:hypothetical protein
MPHRLRIIGFDPIARALSGCYPTEQIAQTCEFYPQCRLRHLHPPCGTGDQCECVEAHLPTPHIS